MSEVPASDAAEAPAPVTPRDSDPAASAADARTGLWRRLCHGLGLLLGTWAAPPWLRWIARGLEAAIGNATATARARPRASVAALLALVLLSIGGYYGHAWWQARPKPVEVSFEVSNPSRANRQ